MKRQILASLFLGVLIIGGIAAAGHRKVVATVTSVPVIRPATKATCFTNAPDKYPYVAASNAPIKPLLLDVDSRQIYAQISMLGRSQRWQFFHQLSGRNKAKVWLVHFQTYKIDHTLTPEQDGFLNQFLPELVDGDLDRDKAFFEGRHIGWKEQAIALFGRQEAWELFVHLGGKSPFADNQQVTRFSLNGTVLVNKPICECTMDSWCAFNWYPMQSTCVTSIFVCDYTPNGCGIYGLDQCRGICVS